MSHGDSTERAEFPVPSQDIHPSGPPVLRPEAETPEMEMWHDRSADRMVTHHAAGLDSHERLMQAARDLGRRIDDVDRKIARQGAWSVRGVTQTRTPAVTGSVGAMAIFLRPLVAKVIGAAAAALLTPVALVAVAIALGLAVAECARAADDEADDLLRTRAGLLDQLEDICRHSQPTVAFLADAERQGVPEDAARARWHAARGPLLQPSTFAARYPVTR